MKKSFCTIYCAAVVLLGGEASAYLMSGNSPLNRAIYSGHDPKLIVAGHIVEVNVKPRPPAVESYPSDVSFQFKVTTVILGQETYKGQTLAIPATSFMWPKELLAFQEGVRCVLVLQANWGEKRDGFYICSVAPVSNEMLRTAKDGGEAKRILAAELLTELKNEPSASRQRHLILQVSPILQQAEAEALVPFLNSDDPWLRRAALAGLVCATKETNYLTMAQQDIERFIQTTQPGDRINLINDPEGRPQLAGRLGSTPPYQLFFSHYFFLAVGWSREDDAAAVAYRPLFRLVAHGKEVPEWVRWDHGVRPLCRVGTREDAKFLYEYCHKMERTETFRSSSNRQEIIMAISRILNLGLLNWVESDFLKKEQEQHRQVSEALVKESILNAGEVHHHPESGLTGDTGIGAR